MNTPELLLWSRIGPEGGFDLAQILYWKEMQRRACGGEFWWGIGAAPARPKIQKLVSLSKPRVIFSKQKTQKHRERRSRILWTKYIDETGTEIPLRKYALITSESISGRAHMAIRARSDKPIACNSGINFDAGLYKHLDGKENLGQQRVLNAKYI